jgi:CTP:molybdopterin cytidylyltransferase MocA
VTVAAVIIASSADEALADVEGLPAVRRLVDLAWSGGALPIVVVAADPAGRVASALAGAPVTLAEPGPDAARAPGGQPIATSAVVRGFDVAAAEVNGTDGVLVWPSGHVWVDAETVTSLIEAHGLATDRVVIPTWSDRPGWPVLIPAAALEVLRALPPTTAVIRAFAELAGAGFGSWPVNLGDPGAVLDASTSRDALPAYEGPPEPVRGGGAREWGAAVADEPEDTPLAGPALAPYPQAAEEGEG